jgi:fructokinase
MADTPLIFGEVLFDVYPDQTEKSGGAPFNVAWHLQAFGLKPVFISRIGSDSRGRKILFLMKRWNMAIEGVTCDPLYPTGIVKVTLEKYNPRFDILPDQSYDHINPENVKETINLKPYALLYHGTLVMRNPESASSLEKVRPFFQHKIFVDINLRTPWWNKEIVHRAVTHATWIKCNEEEFKILDSVISLSCITEDQSAGKLINNYNLESVIITRGNKGGTLYTRNGKIISWQQPCETQILDTVGAGDALSAVFILGILKKWTPEDTLRRSVEFAAAVCGIKGATTTSRKFYTSFRKKWDLDQ